MRTILLGWLLLVSLLEAKPTYALFYQPQAADFNHIRWRERIDSLAAEGFGRLILQWTRYGDYRFDERHSIWLDTLFQSAKEVNLSIITGLDADPDYFRLLERKKLKIFPFLAQRYRQNEATIRALAPRLASMAAFGGWYLPDELDDYLWRSGERTEALRAYLARLDRLIRVETPGAPVYISAYFSGDTPPEAFARFLEHVVPKGWILLLQSGVGAGLVDAAVCRRFYDYFERHYDGRWQPVLELFRMEKGGPIADPDRFRDQSCCLKPGTALFSWRYYFDPKWHTEYRNILQKGDK